MRDVGVRVVLQHLLGHLRLRKAAVSAVLAVALAACSQPAAGPGDITLTSAYEATAAAAPFHAGVTEQSDVGRTETATAYVGPGHFAVVRHAPDGGETRTIVVDHEMWTLDGGAWTSAGTPSGIDSMDPLNLLEGLVAAEEAGHRLLESDGDVVVFEVTDPDAGDRAVEEMEALAAGEDSPEVRAFVEGFRARLAGMAVTTRVTVDGDTGRILEAASALSGPSGEGTTVMTFDYERPVHVEAPEGS